LKTLQNIFFHREFSLETSKLFALPKLLFTGFFPPQPHRNLTTATMSHIAILAGLLAVACAQSTTQVRVVHAVPALPVDVIVNGDVVLPNFLYPTVSDFLPLPGDRNYTVSVRTRADNVTVIGPTTLLLRGGQRYSVAAVVNGTVPQFVVAQHPATFPSASAQLFVWHLSSTAPRVRVRTATFLSASLGFGEAATFPSISAASAQVVLDSNNQTVFDVNPLGLKVGLETSVYAVGNLSVGVATPFNNYTTPALALAVAELAFGVASVRFVHNFPANVPVDIWHGVGSPKVKLLSNIPFGATSGYQALPAPVANLALWVAKAGTTDFLLAGVSFPTVSDGKRQTVVVLPNATDGTPSALVLDDGLIGDLTASAAKIQIVHGVFGAPAVDIKKLGAATNLATNVAYRGTQSFNAVADGSVVTFEVLTTVGGSRVATVPLTLQAGTEYLLVLGGNLTASAPYGLQPLTAMNEIAYLRAVHASYSAPPVDVVVGNVVIGSLSFTDATNFVAVAAGNYSISLNAAGTQVFTTTAALARNVYTTVAAWDDVATLKVAVFDNSPQLPAPTQTHLQFAHLASGVQGVTVAANGSDVFTNVAPAVLSKYVPVAAGTYNVTARVAATNTVALVLPGTVLPPRTAITVFAVGNAAAAANSATALRVIVAVDNNVRDNTKVVDLGAIATTVAATTVAATTVAATTVVEGSTTVVDANATTIDANATTSVALDTSAVTSTSNDTITSSASVLGASLSVAVAALTISSQLN
jgi:hypothetical protein